MFRTQEKDQLVSWPFRKISRFEILVQMQHISESFSKIRTFVNSSTRSALFVTLPHHQYVTKICRESARFGTVLQNMVCTRTPAYDAKCSQTHSLPGCASVCCAAGYEGTRVHTPASDAKRCIAADPSWLCVSLLCNWLMQAAHPCSSASSSTLSSNIALLPSCSNIPFHQYAPIWATDEYLQATSRAEPEAQPINWMQIYWNAAQSIISLVCTCLILDVHYCSAELHSTFM